MYANRSNSAELTFRLHSSSGSVRGTDLLDDTVLGTLVVEDAMWDLAMDEWISREPYRWQWRKLRRWCAEGEALRDERRQLQALARRCQVA
jgi:hypothetical protein